jgi:hypothetical protein
MAIKQIRLRLQAQPLAEQDVLLTVAIDGVERFRQTVPPCDPIVLDEADPSETIEFDLDVPVATANTDPRITSSVSVQCTDGDVKIEVFENNFCVASYPDPEKPNTWIQVEGTATDWEVCNIVSQPLWNGQALLDRYDIQYNLGPIQDTGPGEVLVLSGETVTFDIQINKFNDSLPLPQQS